MEIVVLLSRVMHYLLCLHFNDNSLHFNDNSGPYTYLNGMERIDRGMLQVGISLHSYFAVSTSFMCKE